MAALVVLALGCEVEQTPWPDGGGAFDRGAGGEGGMGGMGGMGGGVDDAGAIDDMAPRDLGGVVRDRGAPLDMALLDMASVDMAPLDVGPADMALPDVGPPDMEPPPTVYRWVIVADDSRDENMAGTAGADICGVSAVCGVEVVLGVEAELVLGDGVVCDGVPGGPCGATRREDPAAALDDGQMCAGGSSPSDYVSLGLSGQLAVDLGRDLRGCGVEVVELAGGDAEGYSVFVCETAVLEAATCVNGGQPVGVSAGGPLFIEL